MVKKTKKVKIGWIVEIDIEIESENKKLAPYEGTVIIAEKVNFRLEMLGD